MNALTNYLFYEAIHNLLAFFHPCLDFKLKKSYLAMHRAILLIDCIQNETKKISPIQRSKQTTLLQPLSLDVFVTESRIIARIPVISAVLDHEDYIDLLTLLNDLSPVLAKLSEGPTEAEKEATAAEIVPSPRIDLLIKTVQIELIMVPFSSLMAQNQESDPLNGPEMTPARNSSPKNLPKSTLKLQLSPVLARIQPDGKIEVKSTVDLLTRNYQMPIKNFENSANLNGAMVLKMIQDPNLLITLHEDKINAIIQNTSLELQNSILGDIVPFLEAPFPPDPAGAPVINLTIENVMIKLLADIPTMYANSYFADLDLEVDQMSIRLNADGSIAIVKNQKTELTNGIAGLTVDPLRRPQAPPRPSIMMRSVSNQTERSALSEKTNTNEALLDLQVITEIHVHRVIYMWTYIWKYAKVIFLGREYILPTTILRV